VILAEPPRSNYDLRFSLAGVPVRVHPWFWAVSVLFMVRPETPPWVVFFWVGVVFVSILVHEFGHVAAFRYFGERAYVVLYSFGGLAIPDDRVADFPRFRTDSDSSNERIIISLAGPAAGFVLAALIVAAVYLSGHRVAYDSGFGRFLSFELGGKPIENFKLLVLVQLFLHVNILWGMVNLLPIFPLDGGQVARELFERYNPRDGLRQSLLLSMFAAAAVALLGWLWYRSFFVALFFGYLAYVSYSTFQSYSGGGFGGGREW
jgi:stage IV sporulation protein FB